MTENTQQWKGRLQILALDGGGIKGLFSAAVLAKIEEKHQVNIVDHFDLITGTSTGGLIAIGLGLGLRPREMVQFYINQGSRIFSNRLGWRSLLHWVHRKYPQKRLAKALANPDAFGDKKLGESRKRLVIPSYNIGQDKVRVFKTPHHARLKTDWQIPAWKVALATTAAPTFFPACTEIETHRLVDGGVWANNPSVIGIAEAVGMLGATLDQIRVLSLGTTDTRKKRGRGLDCGGFLRWMNDVVQILMRGQSVGTNGLAGHLIGSDNVLRIDPVVPEGMYHLDKANKDDLLGEAEDRALHDGPKIQDMFFEHQAREYLPLYPQPSEKQS